MITIEELAKETGFSPTTVSIVLRGKAKDRQISDATAKKILDVANDRGYRPNIAARSLRGGGGARQIQMAVFWAQDFRAGMIVRFLEGLRRRLREIERDIRLVVFPYDNDALSACRQLVSASDCHAAIVCNASLADLDFLEGRTLSLPIVLYNRHSARYCSVNVDDREMGALAARALATNGCKKLAVLTNPPAFPGMKTRVDSFILEALRYGVEVMDPIFCGSSMREGYNAAAQRILTSDSIPDGIFCGASAIGLGVLRAFWEAGVEIPRRCKLVSIGNGPEEFDDFSVPSQSVVRLPMEEMAGQCLSLLLDVMSGSARAPISRLLPLQYIARESCGEIKISEEPGLMG